ncbi:DNA-binding transcriptional regulator, LysR family [Nannocystis exedens]|uniref:DNA-binding transcriptional regulator, LysR family n=1 Tax=Nannocystis exedens TaxID=54 RepID=A0A1I2H7F4_9BACT|nr:LysR family transcriptional regulator [Nannocystis exedens]PCC74014.1 LysR family transcriptional regulator [Nannocystis exedens]SFF24571.1 DNA-binding transcriptional regulator, LysR family [Nannocystis exedens]
MRREDWPDLAVFVAVAEARSFTKAAAKLGLSTSAISHAMTGLEERLGLRLLHRTTRSVAPTAAGERLLATLVPAMDGVAAALDGLAELRDEPAGLVRLTVHRDAALRLLAPRLPELARRFPRVVLEIVADDARADIVAERFDAGVRLGDLLDKDMVSVRIGPDERTAIVASPAYLTRHPPPTTPQELRLHRAINFRHSSGPLFKWELEQDGRKLVVAMESAMITNEPRLMVEAALAGVGLAYVLASHVATHVAAGALVPVLADWCPVFPGSFLYWPSRRHVTPALRAVIEVLRLERRR